MAERLLITLVIGAGLSLLWLGWQLYKTHLMRSIQGNQQATDKLKLLYFTADFCAVCKFQQAPIVEQIAAKFGDAIAVSEVDVSNQPQLASQYKVFTLPTTVVLDQSGQVKHINYGVTPQNKLELQLS